MEIITTPVTPDHLISPKKNIPVNSIHFPPNPTAIFPQMYMNEIDMKKSRKINSPGRNNSQKI